MIGGSFVEGSNLNGRCEVLTIGVLIAAIGLGLAIIGMLVATAPPRLTEVGWVLFAVGLVLIVVALVLDASDNGDHARVLRSSWGVLLLWPGLRKRLLVG
jgi:hypothetical protein